MGEVVKKIEGVILAPSICADFIAREYGIKAKVNLIDGCPALKFYNHLSLFTMINKVRRHFDFTVIHRKEDNEYIMIISKMHKDGN